MNYQKITMVLEMNKRYYNHGRLQDAIFTLSTEEKITDGTTGTAVAISRTKKSATLFILAAALFCLLEAALFSCLFNSSPAFC
jgi:hypothetical protein